MFKKIALLLFYFLIIFSKNILASSSNSPGELKVIVMASDSPKYIEEWISTPTEHNVFVKRLSETISEKTFYVAVVVTGYMLTTSMNVQLTGDLIVQNPDGKTQVNEKAAFSYETEMNKGGETGYVMLNPAIDFTFTDDDKKGTYTFKVTVADHVAGKTAAGECQIVLKQAGAPDDLSHLLTDEIASAAQLDQMWQAFFASGDERYVVRIVNALAWSTSETKDFEKRLIGSAASWSLKSNAKQHPSVLDICKKQLSIQTGIVKEVLKTITAEVTDKKD